MVALTGVEPDGCQFRPVQMGLSGCVLSPVGIPRSSEAQSQRSRGPRDAGEAAAPGRCGRRRFPGAGRAEKVESREEMPEVTRFFGIVIRMYFRDHTPHISTPNTANPRLSLRLTRSPFSGESSRGEPWRWYSNGQPFIARN